MNYTSTMQLKSKGVSLPNGWRWVKIGDIAEVSTGGTPDTTHPEYYGGDIRWLKSGDVKGTYIDEVPNRISQLGLDNSNARIHPAGSVMLAMSGQGKTRGTSAILRVPSTCSQSVAAILPSEHAIPEIIHYALVNRYDETRRITGDDERTGLNLRIIRDIVIPLPPLDEQRRIASRLSEQLAAVESARKAAEEQLQAANALRAGYIRQFVEDQVFQKWSSVKLGELLVETRNGLYKPDKFYGQGKRILKMYNIGRLDGTWNLKRVDLIDLTDKEYDDYRLEVGDILLNRVNSRELVGKSAVINEKTEGAVFESKNILVRVDNTRVLSDFVATYTNSKFGRVQFERKLKQIVGQATINRSDLDSFEIPLPPYNIQQKIISELKSKQIEIDNLEAALESQLAEIESLPASLLREAFAGQG